MRAALRACAAGLLVLAACGGGGSGPSGRASQDDGIDARMAVNSKGKHPTKDQRSADVRNVTLTADGKTMTIVFTVDGPLKDDVPPDQLEGPDWFVQLWTGAAAAAPDGIVGIVRRGTVAIQNGEVRAGWKVLACLGSESCDKDAAGAVLSIAGNTVKAVVPLGDLPKLGKTFTWTAFSFWNESTDIQTAFTDWVPDGAEPPKQGFTPPKARATFPS